MRQMDDEPPLAKAMALHGSIPAVWPSLSVCACVPGSMFVPSADPGWLGACPLGEELPAGVSDPFVVIAVLLADAGAAAGLSGTCGTIEADMAGELSCSMLGAGKEGAA